MIEGLDRFVRHFIGYTEQYVLIGGAACTLLMEDVGRDFRATKDLDIVLCVDDLSPEFVKAFWQFVHEGEYQAKEKDSGEKQFYRFQKPAQHGYPFMLELFSRVPDVLSVAEGSHLTPIPVDASISSLSAILLDTEYYSFLGTGTRIVRDCPVVGPEHLIPLKARAWLDVTQRKAEGAQIGSSDIKKHRNDVFRLLAIIDPEFSGDIPSKIAADLASFVERMETESIALKDLGLGNQTFPEVIAELRRVYRLD